MALPNPNRHLSDGDALGRTKLKERFTEHPEELQAVFGDVVFPRDEIDAIMDGASVEQARSSFTPWRSRFAAAPAPLVKTAESPGPVVPPLGLLGGYEAMTAAQRAAHREALMDAEIASGDVAAMPVEDASVEDEVDPWS